MAAITPIGVVIALVLFSLYFLTFPIKKVHHTLDSIQNLLDPLLEDKGEPLRARSTANKRLIRAFHLTNTFVSPSTDVHSAFVYNAKRRLRLAAVKGWPDFRRTINEAIDEILANVDSIPFDTFVQDITFRVVLIELLGVDVPPHRLNTESVRIVTSLITELWTLSKQSAPIPADLLPQLNSHLRLLIPDDETYPNPLDYVIPAWETLWRVVATIIAYACQHPSVDQVFSRLETNPTVNQFKACIDGQPAVEYFVLESMRLHPPSRRIGRCFSYYPSMPLPSFIQRLVKCILSPVICYEYADIEAAMRSENIWGPDADRFNPSRYEPGRVTQEQRLAQTLPFGYGPYKCIAGSWAPMAVGVFAAVIIGRLSTSSDHKLVQGKIVGGRDGWNGWSVNSEKTLISSS